MRIAYVVDIFPKRSETFVRDEIEWLAQRGQLDRVFTLASEPEALDELSPEVRERIRVIPAGDSSQPGYGTTSKLRWWAHQPGLLATRLLARSMSRESFELFCDGLQLARMFQAETAPDLVHVHFAGRMAQVTRYACRTSGIPFTLCVHHYDIFHSAPHNYPALARDARALVTISNYNRDYLETTYRMPPNKIHVIHCGISGETFKRAADPSERLDDPVLRLTSVGRLTSIKAQQYQIEACKILRDRGVSVRLRLIGDGDRRAELDALIETHGLTDCVELLGAQPSSIVRSELQAADIFVMSSLSEGIPVALMEAMATELPVVTTGVRGIPELVEHDVSGLLVPIEDSEALADAIQRLNADPALRQRLSLAGRAKVLQAFDAETEYARLAYLWERLLCHDRPSNTVAVTPSTSY